MEEENQNLLSSKSSEFPDPKEVWEEDRYIWDKKELIAHNKRRAHEDVIPYVLRYE